MYGSEVAVISAVQCLAPRLSAHYWVGLCAHCPTLMSGVLAQLCIHSLLVCVHIIVSMRCMDWVCCSFPSDGPGMVEMGHVAVFGSNFHHPRPTCIALVFLISYLIPLLGSLAIYTDADPFPTTPNAQNNRITLRWTTCGTGGGA